jgi:hypothetical protein
MRTPTRGSLVAFAVAATALSAPNGPTSPCVERHSDAQCLRSLDAVESVTLHQVATGLAQHGRVDCRVLGEFIRDHLQDARIVPYPIATPYGSATGDAHVREHPAGTGRIHVADSVIVAGHVMARPLSAKIETLLHDYAHLAMDIGQYDTFFATDLAGDLAVTCLSAESSESKLRH